MEKSDQWRAKDGYMDFQSERKWNIGLNFAIALWPLNSCALPNSLWGRCLPVGTGKPVRSLTNRPKQGLKLAKWVCSFPLLLSLILYIPQSRQGPGWGKTTQLCNCVSPLFSFSHFLWKLKKEIISSCILLSRFLYISFYSDHF